MTSPRESASGASDTLFRVMMGELSAVLWTTDTQLLVTSCLGAALSHRDLSANEAVGMPLADFFQCEATESPIMAAHRHALRGEPISCDVSWGDQTLQAFVAPQRNHEREVVGCSGFAREITPRDREAEELYRLFNLSLQMLCIAGRDGFFKRVNPAFEKTLGYAPNELLQRPFVDFVHPEDRDATLQYLEQLADGERTVHFENRYRCQDGSYRWLSWTSLPHGEDGLVYAVALDITERKRAEGLFRALLESAPDGVVVVDGGGHIVLLNRMAEEVFGYKRDELLGQPVESLIPDRFRSQHRNNRQRFLSRPKLQGMGGSACVCARRRDGTEFPVEVRLSPVEVEGARVVFAAVRDVSEREQLQRSLREQECQLLAAQRIQQHLLPQSSPQIPGLDIAGTVVPAAYAGGDHFDYLAMSDGRLGVLVGDVSGHGFDSALVMASTHELLRAGVGLHDDVSAVLSHANQALLDEVECGIFVTVLFVCVEMPARKLMYANAGHPYGIVLDASGHVRTHLESTSIPLVVLPEADFPVRGPLQMQSGDCIVMVTDGVLEAHGANHEQFGEERLIHTIRSVLNRPARHIVKTLTDAVRSFSVDGELQDDVTTVVLKIH
jgi:PAS domain S-box-containing protein